MLPHSPALDGLRGLAILLVLALHLTIIKPVTAVDQAITSVLHAGWMGVDLFFVLSGFLITGILIDSRGSDRYFLTFYARRTLRIVPLYYLVVFVSFVVLPHFPTWYDRLVGPKMVLPEWEYWLFLSNIGISDRDRFLHGILGVSWSLSIEEQLASSMLFLAVVRAADSWWPRLLSAKWLRSLGRYSYALYLFHLPVMRTMRDLVFDPRASAPVVESV